MGLFSRVKEWFFPSIHDRELLMPGRVYTKSDINTWMYQARLGDTRYLSSFKEEMRASDPDLDSHIIKLEAMLSQAPFDVQPWPMVPGWKKVKSPEEQLAADVTAYCREQILDPDIDRQQVVVHALWGLLEGVTGFQVLVKIAGGKEKLIRLDQIPSERFWWGLNTTTLQVFPTDDQFKPVPVADLGDSIAVCVKDPHRIVRDRVGVIRRCFAPWLTRRNGLEWWGASLQKYGQPWPKGKYKGTLTADQLTKLEKLMQNVGPNGYGLFPDAIDVEFVQGLVRAGQSPHLEAAEYCEKAYAKVLLGGTQTADIQKGAGSLASATVHEAMLEAFVAYYASQIGSFIRSQILKPMVRRNFGPEVAEKNTPLVTIHAGRRAELLTFFQALKEAKAMGFGPSIPRAWIHMQTSIPVPEDDEPVLDAPVAPPPMLPPAQGPDPTPPDQGPDITQQAASPTKSLASLEDWATGFSRGAGDEILAPYVKLIEETKRDGGDLGHLAARIRLQAQMAGEPPAKTADLIAAVMSQAILTGYSDGKRS